MNVNDTLSDNVSLIILFSLSLNLTFFSTSILSGSYQGREPSRRFGHSAILVGTKGKGMEKTSSVEESERTNDEQVRTLLFFLIFLK